MRRRTEDFPLVVKWDSKDPIKPYESFSRQHRRGCSSYASAQAEAATLRANGFRNVRIYERMPEHFNVRWRQIDPEPSGEIY